MPRFQATLCTQEAIQENGKSMPQVSAISTTSGSPSIRFKGKETSYAIHNCGCSDSALAVGNSFVKHDWWVYPHSACHCRRSCSVAYYQRPKIALTTSFAFPTSPILIMGFFPHTHRTHNGNTCLHVQKLPETSKCTMFAFQIFSSGSSVEHLIKGNKTTLSRVI